MSTANELEIKYRMTGVLTLQYQFMQEKIFLVVMMMVLMMMTVVIVMILKMKVMTGVIQ